MNKVNLPYVMCVVFLRFYGVFSRLPLAPTKEQDKRQGVPEGVEGVLPNNSHTGCAVQRGRIFGTLI